MQGHLQTDCQLVLLDCNLCHQKLPKRQFFYHTDFECVEAPTKCINYPQCQASFLRKRLQEHLSIECAYEPAYCRGECGLALPRGQLIDHNCARELKIVYDRVLKENKNLSKNDRMLREENKRLLELVENTADRI